MLARLCGNSIKTCFLKKKKKVIHGCISKSASNHKGDGAKFVYSVHLFVVILFHGNSGIKLWFIMLKFTYFQSSV